MRHLTIPESVERNGSAVEILRAWVLPSDEIEFVTRAFPMNDPALLGIFFADLARHYFGIAKIETEHWPQALRRVADGLTAEADAQELGVPFRHSL